MVVRRPEPPPRPATRPERADVPDEVPKPMPDAPMDRDRIIDWMRLKPVELPPGIKQHIEYRPGAVTSVASTVHEGATYEIYLMARLALQELHVVLVTGETSYYLIDRSFQREGRSFRLGTVRRSGDAIMGIVSEERAAASPEAQVFYSIFLAWWDAEILTLQ